MAKKKDFKDEREERMYNDLLQAEIRKKLKEKIANNDPEIVKTIKYLLESDTPPNSFNKK
jgi:hypothetical protein